MRILSTLSRVAVNLDFSAALASLSEAIRLGKTDDYSIQALANRAAYEGLGIEIEDGPDLSAYDRAFLAPAGEEK